MKLKKLALLLVAFLSLSFAAFAQAEDEEVLEEEVFEEEFEDEEAEAPKVRKGRGAFYFTADSLLTFPVMDFSEMTWNNFNLDLTWKICNFIFMGIEGGYNLPNQVWDAGLSLGLNANLGQIRPYLMATTLYSFDQDAVVKLGGGLDLRLGVFLFTFGYNYKLSWDVSAVIAEYESKGMDALSLLKEQAPARDHVVYSGIGLSW